MDDPHEKMALGGSICDRFGNCIYAKCRKTWHLGHMVVAESRAILDMLRNVFKRKYLVESDSKSDVQMINKPLSEFCPSNKEFNLNDMMFFISVMKIKALMAERDVEVRFLHGVTNVFTNTIVRKGLEDNETHVRIYLYVFDLDEKLQRLLE